MHPSRGRRPNIYRKDKQQGIALILVLWIIAILSMMSLEFTYSMRTQLSITRNILDETKAYYLARAGFNLAIIHLLVYNKLRTLKRYGKEGEVQQTMETEELDWSWIGTGEPKEIDWQEGRLQIKISDEGGKLNINLASQLQLRKLLTITGVAGQERDIIVDSILDWRDTINLHRLNGAEDDYYESLDPPYSCKDGYFDTIEELLYVRGVTPEIFYGTGGEEGESEQPSYQGLAPYITVYPTFPHPTAINVNTAPALVLQTIPGITEEVAQLIIMEREREIFSSIDDFWLRVGRQIEGGNFGLIQQRINTSPPTTCTIEVTGQPTGSQVKRTIRAVIKLRPYSSPPYRVLYWKDYLW